MKSTEKFYDISVALGKDSIDWPGLPPYGRELVSEIKKGGDADVSQLNLNCHLGTHVDTPAHFIADGKNLDEYPITKWILPAQVVRITDKQAVSVSELRNFDIQPGEAILFQTDNSMLGRSTNGVFAEGYVYISADAADYLVDKKVSLVGLDYGCVDEFSNPKMPAHKKILGAGILILENINLKDVPTGRYTLYSLPLRISGTEASPARAILVR